MYNAELKLKSIFSLKQQIEDQQHNISIIYRKHERIAPKSGRMVRVVTDNSNYYEYMEKQ